MKATTTAPMRRFLSVCSGIDAASVAWNPLGWEAAALSEIAPFPRAVLKHHYPDIPLFGDFTAIPEGALRDLGPVQLLCGGTPCQSFSVAGLRAGMADPRGNLALAFLRLADLLRPRWVVWENVPGVLSSNGGRDFGAFVGALGQLGYGWAYRVLDAQHCGVPQRRRRVFVVGCAGNWAPAAAVLFERHSLSGHPAPRRQAGARVAGALATGFGSGGADDNGARAGHLVSEGVAANLNRETGKGWWTEGLAGLRAEPGGMPENVVTQQAWQDAGGSAWREGQVTLAASDDNGSNQVVTQTLRGEGFDASEDGTGRETPLVPVFAPTPIDMRQASRGERMTNNRPGGSSGGAPGTGIGEPGDPAPSLSTSHVPAVAFSCKDSDQDAGELCPTLRSMAHSMSHANGGGQVAIAIQERADSVGPGGLGGKGWNEEVAFTMEARHRPQSVSHSMAVRRLTPRECERLQGFPDDYTLIPGNWRVRKGHDYAETVAYLRASGFSAAEAAHLANTPDGPRYHALGNSWATVVARWIGERIDMVDTVLGIIARRTPAGVA